MGRGPDWSPVADLDDSVWVEVATAGPNSRLVVPAAARKRLAWASVTSTVQVLAVIELNGSVELLPWDPAGGAAMARLASALEASLADDRAPLAIAAADRYVRLGLEKDGRINLPINLALHLSAADGAAVRVVAGAQRLWLWNETRWVEGRRARFDQLDDVLGHADLAGTPGS